MVIDGAHAPGQIDLDLDALGADFYVGNCHKWLCGPKGAAFLHTRRERQQLIAPLIIGWGWGKNRKPSRETDFIEALQRQGTDDLSAYLTIPAAIEFQRRHHWQEVRAHCHDLLATTLKQARELTGLYDLYPEQGQHYAQMAVMALPPINDLASLNRCLYEKYRIQIPCITWNGHQFLRISVQAYNSEKDLEILLDALHAELPNLRG